MVECTGGFGLGIGLGFQGAGMRNRAVAADKLLEPPPFHFFKPTNLAGRQWPVTTLQLHCASAGNRPG